MKFQAVADQTAKDARGLLYFAAPGRFIVCYRPPYYDSQAGDYAASLIKCLAILVNVNYTVIISGDLNLPNVNWSNFITHYDQICEPLASFFQNEGFIQYVTEPTRKIDSILDVVLCNEQIMISDCQTVASIGNSDYIAVLFKVMLPNNATYKL